MAARRVALNRGSQTALEPELIVKPLFELVQSVASSFSPGAGATSAGR